MAMSRSSSGRNSGKSLASSMVEEPTEDKLVSPVTLWKNISPDSQSKDSAEVADEPKFVLPLAKPSDDPKEKHIIFQVQL